MLLILANYLQFTVSSRSRYEVLITLQIRPVELL